MAGATAAGVTASQASAITINLVGNYLSAAGGNHLNADLTGDGHPDLTIANAFITVTNVKGTYNGFTYPSYNRSFVKVKLNGLSARGYNDHDFGFGTVNLGSRHGSWYRGSYISSASLTGAIPIFFKDLHINGGAPTRGSLEVTVSSVKGDTANVQLDSFTYNTPGVGARRAVPDQGSSLALLAMGAVGILALRRWRAGQGRS